MTNSKQDLFLVIKNGKSGFINRNGEIIIDFVYEDASSFSEGLARVFVEGKTGFINVYGELVIPPVFDNALGFSDGLSVVTIGDKQGYINMQGDIVIEPSYYRADSFENGIARVMDDIFSTGCFINKEGKVILSNKNFFGSKFSDGLINCSEKTGWGHVDLQGQFIIPPMYEYTMEFSEGKAAVSPKKGSKNVIGENIYGFINKNNEMIIPPTFKGSDIRFSEGLCAVWDNGYGYINDKGILVIPFKFYLGEHFSEGLAAFQATEERKFGYIDKDGQVVIKPVFTSADNFENGLAAVVTGNNYEEFKYGYIDKNGRYVWEPTR